MKVISFSSVFVTIVIAFGFKSFLYDLDEAYDAAVDLHRKIPGIDGGS